MVRSGPGLGVRPGPPSVRTSRARELGTVGRESPGGPPTCGHVAGAMPLCEQVSASRRRGRSARAVSGRERRPRHRAARHRDRSDGVRPWDSAVPPWCRTAVGSAGAAEGPPVRRPGGDADRGPLRRYRRQGGAGTPAAAARGEATHRCLPGPITRPAGRPPTHRPHPEPWPSTSRSWTPLPRTSGRNVFAPPQRLVEAVGSRRPGNRPPSRDRPAVPCCPATSRNEVPRPTPLPCQGGLPLRSGSTPFNEPAARGSRAVRVTPVHAASAPTPLRRPVRIPSPPHRARHRHRDPRRLRRGGADDSPRVRAAAARAPSRSHALRTVRGTAPAAASPCGCPTAPAPRGSAPGSPSPGRGSPAVHRTPAVPAGSARRPPGAHRSAP